MPSLVLFSAMAFRPEVSPSYCGIPLAYGQSLHGKYKYVLSHTLYHRELSRGTTQELSRGTTRLAFRKRPFPPLPQLRECPQIPVTQLRIGYQIRPGYPPSVDNETGVTECE